MENNIYYQQKFQNLISVSKSLSIGYGILRYVYLREELNKGVHEFLGEKFKTWDDSISEFLLAKMSNIYESNFTINDIYTLWNNGDVRIYFDKDTIRKKVREFEKNLDNMNQAFFSKQDKDELLKIINETWFGKEYKKISHILFEINKGLTQKYSDRSQDEMLLSLDKKLFLIPFEGIVEMGLELDTSRVIKQENDYYIFKSLEDKRKTLQNLEEQVKQKYNLFIDEFSSKYSLMIYGDLRAPLTNISFEFLSNCRAIIVDFKYKIVKIGEKHYDFDIPVVKTESKAGDKKSKIKQGNYQKVYNSAFVSEFIKFLREDLGKSNRQYRKVRYFDFPTRKEIYDNLLKLKSDKERLIFRVGEYNNKIIAPILESVISSCCTTLSKMYELRQIFIIFFGIHYQVTFYKYYSIAEEFPNYIMEKIIFLSGLYFDYTLKNILFESSEEYATKMINLNIQEEHQEQLDLFNSKYNQINYYVKERPKNLTFNYKYDKNSPKDMDDFVFIKTATAVRKEPNTKSGVLKNAAYSHKYKVIGKVKTNVPGGTAEWYEVYFDGKLGYVLAANAIKREFDWNDMMKRAEKTNNFIKEAVTKNQKIYVLDDYTPLGGGNGSSKDKYGNKENQSERGYLSSSFKEFINIPDRSIMTITEETDKYIKVKIDVYDDKEYYLQKSNKKLLKDSGIKEEVSRFIYVDRHSQNEMIIEKNKGSNSWNVVTSSFVTTGKDGNGSYATPYGVFHVAYSKPVMQYTGSAGTVVGDAKNAIRFSGGGYMHSIPSLFEPKNTREQRKAATAKKIGTYPESHKCIRHYDDQIKFIYDWLGNASPGDKNGFRVPEVPTVMLVK